jgi:ADP-ribose pyrophosphatase YjhB (NUDIX family)
MFASTGNFQGGLVARNNYAQTWVAPGTKEIRLPGGMIARQCWVITAENEDRYDQAKKTMANLMDPNWVPKLIPGKSQLYGNSTIQMQRCPRIWVDNFIFFYKPGMKEPLLLLGEWRKNVTIYGTKTDVHGLVVAGGGHYETMGNRGTAIEAGHMSMSEAADREVFEEVKIPKDRLKATQFLGFVDNVFNDPRTHGIRNIYLRHVEMEPSATDELKTVIAAPVSMLHDLCTGKQTYQTDKGLSLGFILNHESMVEFVMNHPDVKQFVARIQETAAPSYAGAVVFGSDSLPKPAGCFNQSAMGFGKN